MLLVLKHCSLFLAVINSESCIRLVFYLGNIGVVNLSHDLANHMWTYLRSRSLNTSVAKGNAMGCTSETV